MPKAMKLSNADEILNNLDISQYPHSDWSKEAKAQLHQALIANLPSKRKIEKLKADDAYNLNNLAKQSRYRGYNQCLDEVNKILKEFFK